jgi:RNA polymerase sigma factor (sigma-70 family)
MQVTRTELIESCVRLANSIAASRWRLFRGAELEEMQGVAQLALVEAADRWDPAKGPFVTYAWHKINYALIDHVRETSRYCRYNKRRMAEFVSLDDAAGYREDRRPATVGSLLRDPADPAGAQALIRRDEVDVMLRLLQGKDLIVFQRLLKGEKSCDIAADMRLSESRISQLKRRVVMQLRPELSHQEVSAMVRAFGRNREKPGQSPHRASLPSARRVKRSDAPARIEGCRDSGS